MPEWLYKKIIKYSQWRRKGGRFMKRNFMKKALAVTLSAAMAFSVPMVSNLSTASAASKNVTLNVTKKTMKVGQKNYKLKLKNHKTYGWKIKKVSTTKKSVVTPYGKKATYVKLKAKKKGTATIKVTVKSTKKKKNTTKVLKCKVTVKAATTTPTPNPDQTPDPIPAVTTATAATQAELEEALKNTSITTLKIETQNDATFNIPAGTYTNVDLTVNAPKADVTNEGTFKSIKIDAIKDSTWTEKAKGNKINVAATAAVRIVVAATGSLEGITFSGVNKSVKLEVQKGGAVKAVTVTAKVELTISGESTEAIPVSVQGGAADAKVTSNVPVKVTALASVEIKLEKGAEGSTVEVTVTSANVTLDNQTTSKVELKKPDGKTEDVAAGKKGTVTATTQPTTPTTPGTNTGSGSGTGTAVAKPATANGMKVTTARVQSTSGYLYTVESGSAVEGAEAAVVTRAALDVVLDASAIRTVSDDAAEGVFYTVECRYSLDNKNWTGIYSITRKSDKAAEVAFKGLDVLESERSFTLYMQYRVAETGSNKAGEWVDGASVTVNIPQNLELKK